MTEMELISARPVALIAGQAWSLTHAVLATRVRLPAEVADAAVAPTQVLTHPVFADVWVQTALVDVWEATDAWNLKNLESV